MPLEHFESVFHHTISHQIPQSFSEIFFGHIQTNQCPADGTTAILALHNLDGDGLVIYKMALNCTYFCSRKFLPQRFCWQIYQHDILNKWMVSVTKFSTAYSPSPFHSSKFWHWRWFSWDSDTPHGWHSYILSTDWLLRPHQNYDVEYWLSWQTGNPSPIRNWCITIFLVPFISVPYLVNIKHCYLISFLA